MLKSAAASAIYGARATNGVVVITTKRGRQGRATWNVTQRVGTQHGAQHLLGGLEVARIFQVHRADLLGQHLIELILGDGLLGLSLLAVGHGNGTRNAVDELAKFTFALP